MIIDSLHFVDDCCRLPGSKHTMLASLTKVAIEEAQALVALESELLDAWQLDDWLKLLHRRHDLPGADARNAGRVAGDEPVPDQRRPLSHGKPGEAAQEAD